MSTNRKCYQVQNVSYPRMYDIINCTFTQCYHYKLFPTKMLPIRMLPIQTAFKIFYQYKRLSIENVLYTNFVHTDQ